MARRVGKESHQFGKKVTSKCRNSHGTPAFRFSRSKNEEKHSRKQTLFRMQNVQSKQENTRKIENHNIIDPHMYQKPFRKYCEIDSCQDSNDAKKNTSFYTHDPNKPVGCSHVSEIFQMFPKSLLVKICHMDTWTHTKHWTSTI